MARGPANARVRHASRALVRRALRALPCRGARGRTMCLRLLPLPPHRVGDGPMVAALRATGIEATHVRYDQQRPDLSKFDSLLGSVLLEASKSLHANAVERAQHPARGGVLDASSVHSSEGAATAALSIAVDEVRAIEQGSRSAVARSAAQLQMGEALEAVEGVAGTDAVRAQLPPLPLPPPSGGPGGPSRQTSDDASEVHDYEDATVQQLELEDQLRQHLHSVAHHPRGR